MPTPRLLWLGRVLGWLWFVDLVPSRLSVVRMMVWLHMGSGLLDGEEVCIRSVLASRMVGPLVGRILRMGRYVR